MDRKSINGWKMFKNHDEKNYQMSSNNVLYDWLK
jgi:hypothetical protein